VGEPVFRRLMTAIGAPELVPDERFRTSELRARNEDALDAIITAWTATQSTASAEATLETHGVPAARIFTLADIFKDPHYEARGAIARAPDRQWGSVAMADAVPRLSATPGEIRHAGPGEIGKDTAEVLRSLAGLNDAEIGALSSAGVIVCAPAT